MSAKKKIAKHNKNTKALAEERGLQTDESCASDFIQASAAPLYKIEDASRKSYEGVQTAHNQLDRLVTQSFDSEKFYRKVAAAQEALKAALRHRQEHDRLDQIKKSEAGRYR